MDIKDIMNRAFDTADKKGWHNPPKSFGESLLLVHAEVSEAAEDYRSKPVNLTWFEGDNQKPRGVPSELADVIIRVCHLAKEHGIDLDSAIEMKLDFNETRPYRHGGKLL